MSYTFDNIFDWIFFDEQSESLYKTKTRDVEQQGTYNQWVDDNILSININPGTDISDFLILISSIFNLELI